MATKTYYLSVTFDDEGHNRLPSVYDLVRTIARSNVGEAISQGCKCAMAIHAMDWKQTALINAAESLLSASKSVEELLDGHGWGEGPARRALRDAISKAVPNLA